MTENNRNEQKSKKKKIGIINERIGFTAKIIIDKEEAPNPIYPIDQSMPIYISDEKDNIFLIYEQKLIAPDSNLPSLSYLSEEGNVVLNPAKNFILQSSLSDFIGNAVLVNEDAIPALLLDVFRIEEDDLKDIWKTNGFRHLRLIADILGAENFTIFTHIYKEFFSHIIIEDEELRKKLVKILVQIKEKLNLSDTTEYLDILKEFMGENSAVLILDNKMSDIKALIKNNELKYGDLVYFENSGIQTLAVIKEVHSTAILDLLFAIENGNPTSFVSPLNIGSEGKIDGVSEIIEALTAKYGAEYVQIPIGYIPKIKKEYNVFLKGNELIHFAIIAISGSGKGNTVKELIFEYHRKHIIFKKNQRNNKSWNPLGIILFDDVGEYVKCLKPRDWGINIGVMLLKFVYNIKPLIHFVDVSGRVEDNPPSLTEYEFLDIQLLKIPIEYIPLDEILRKIEGQVAYGVVLAYLRQYYNDHPDLCPIGFPENRFTIDFINWFLSQPFEFNQEGRRDQFYFTLTSYLVAVRTIKEFLFHNGDYLGIYFNRRDDQFVYPGIIREEIKDKEGNTLGFRLKKKFNLLELAIKCADRGETLVIDESSLKPLTKLLIQRIILNRLVEYREARGFDPNIRPCLFIIEEATALMRGKGFEQIELFGEIQVKARKFGIGIGLVLQDITRLDPTLLTQLGWMIAMGLPVDSMRNIMFKNVPADLKSYEDYVKYADIGVAVGFQMLIARNLPLPIRIYHYERKVKEMLWNKDNWDGDEYFDEDYQNNLRNKFNQLKIPEDVINEILTHGGEK